MNSLLQPGNNLTVDEIIERVLIRNSSSSYNYCQGKDHNQLTQPQHIWHYQLQEQNLQLKQKIKLLKSKFKKKTDTQMKHLLVKKQIDSLRSELENLVKNNAHLQKEINKTRLKHSQIDQTIRNSLDQSLKKRKGSRQCPCYFKEKRKESDAKGDQKSCTKHINSKASSPQKQILRRTKDVSINCQFSNTDNQRKQQIKHKKQFIYSLKKMIQNQDRLIKSYQSQIEQKNATERMERNQTMASTSRFQPFEKKTSNTTFKPPLSSVGSIIKIKRY